MMRGFFLWAGLLAGAWLPGSVAGAGLYEDFGESSSFILSSRVPSVSASLSRLEDEGRDTFLYSLFAAYPIKSTILMQAEQSYITASSPGGIDGGFGDLRFRLRMVAYSRSGRALHVISALRTGSGSREVYPFSSGSIDLTLGVSWIDSLSLLNYWGEASATTVWRGPEGYDEDTAHDDYLTLSAGISFPLADSFDIRLFGTGYFLFSGPVREIYGVLASYRTSEFMSLFASLQAEGGKDEFRVTDFAAVAGTRIYY